MAKTRSTLERFGIRPEWLEQVSAGAGVVGNTTYATIAYCAMAGVTAFAGLASHPYETLLVISIEAVPYLVYVVGTWRFADKHPDAAALGGSNYLALMNLMQTARGVTISPDSPIIEDPTSRQKLPKPKSPDGGNRGK